MSAVIRNALPPDRDALVQLLVAQLREHDVETPEPEIAQLVDLLLLRPHRGRFVVALESERAVGLAALSFGFPVEHGGRGAWLEELYVEPASRGRGLGERLLQAALAAAEAAGAVAIDLEIEKGHERVESLYRRTGFAPLARVRWALRLGVRQAEGHGRPTQVTGGCFCGEIRYEATSLPREISHCHCSICRRAAGAAFVTWATYAYSAFRWAKGEPAELHSSPPVTRRFCRACGTPLTFFTSEEPEWIDVTVASMDQAAEMWPDEHIWTNDKLPWLALDDDLPRFPRGHRD